MSRSLDVLTKYYLVITKCIRGPSQDQNHKSQSLYRFIVNILLNIAPEIKTSAAANTEKHFYCFRSPEWFQILGECSLRNRNQSIGDDNVDDDDVDDDVDDNKKLKKRVCFVATKKTNFGSQVRWSWRKSDRTKTPELPRTENLGRKKIGQFLQQTIYSRQTKCFGRSVFVGSSSSWLSSASVQSAVGQVKHCGPMALLN